MYQPQRKEARLELYLVPLSALTSQWSVCLRALPSYQITTWHRQVHRLPLSGWRCCKRSAGSSELELHLDGLIHHCSNALSPIYCIFVIYLFFKVLEGLEPRVERRRGKKGNIRECLHDKMKEQKTAHSSNIAQ
jgi:hypothetical protein